MPADSAVRTWNLTMPLGSELQWAFKFTLTDGVTPYPGIGSATWEYVARTSPTDLSSPLIDVTLTPSAEGAIAVTSTASLAQAVLTLNPAATSGLSPGTLFHTLWANPGTSTAYCWVTGQLVIQGTPQP